MEKSIPSAGHRKGIGIKMFLDMVWDTLKDGCKLLPFLFLTYLIMEAIEHKAGTKAERTIQKSGKWGPFIGALLGAVPQCGFSAAASNLYAGRIITLGTLFSVFLSTSDEMLPVLISEQVAPLVILKILGMKIIIGMAAGFLVDLVLRRKKNKKEVQLQIEHMCEHQHCHCGEGKIFKSALHHTLQIFSFILLISFFLNLLIGVVGEESLSAFLTGKKLMGPVLAGLVGLIPNCAASVVITQLYLEGLLTTGSMLSGLLAGAGVGLLILFKVNDDKKENLQITGLLYGIGVVVGIVTDVAGFLL